MSCFLFQVTATGWNLQTVQTRFEQTEVGWKNGELEIIDDLGAKYLVIVFSRSLKMRELSFAQFCYKKLPN